MSYLRDRVIILKQEPYREQDRRYVMYGREHGLLEAVARGAALGTSKQAGHLEPFTEAEVMLAQGSRCDKLAVAQRLDSSLHASSLIEWSAVTRDRLLAGFVVCGVFVDLVIRLTRPGIADARVFDLIHEAILCAAQMPQAPSPERARLLHAAATLRLLDLLGFGPIIQMVDDRSQITVILLKFMRRAALADILRVTAPRDVLNAASAFVEQALQHAPLDQEPHGVKTIQAYLT